MPESERDKGGNPIVDSLAMASDWTVVSKCALHGLIYIWDLKGTIKNTNFKDAKENQVIEKEVTLLAQLKWSDTDNFYMNLGCHKGKGLICCGDDKGSLWLYNVPQFGKDSAAPIKKVVDPSARLMWLELQDVRT